MFVKEYKISSQELIEEDVVPLRKLKFPKKSKLCVRLVTVGCSKDRWQTCMRDAETPVVPLEQVGNISVSTRITEHKSLIR